MKGPTIEFTTRREASVTMADAGGWIVYDIDGVVVFRTPNPDDAFKLADFLNSGEFEVIQ